MKRQSNHPQGKTNVPDDSDPQDRPAVKPRAIEPLAIGDDVYDPRSDSEQFPLPEDIPPLKTNDESRDS